ncbi:MAG: dihydropteroate synthase, partial [Clostridiaceae bacterium]|nr:dihydropteroate synthase [Clostridiaceae bacterium]
IRQTEVIHEMGYTCFLGVSRKRFIQNILDEAGFNMDPDTETGYKNRDLASAALTAVAASKGVEVVRVHSAEEHAIAATIGDMVRLAENIEDINFSAY